MDEQGDAAAAGPAGGMPARNALAALVLLLLGLANRELHLAVPALVGWLPAGAALSFVVLCGPRILPGVFVGTAAAVFAIAGEALPALANAVATALAAGAALAAARHAQRGSLRTLGVRPLAVVLLSGIVAFGLAAFALGDWSIARLVAHPEAASAGHAMLPGGHAPAAIGHAMEGDPPAAGGDVLEWLLAEPIGVVLVVPAALWVFAWRREVPPAPPDGAPAVADAWAPWAAGSLLLLVTGAIYSGFVETRFGIVHTTLLVLPPAVWLAFAARIPFTIAANLAVGLLTALGTTWGHGPFKDHSSGLPLLTLVFTMTTLAIAAGSAERRRAAAEIMRLATRDALTGLANRAAFLDRVAQSLAAARRYGTRIGLLFVDLDHFKTINDTRGHQVGDRLLVEAADRLRGCLRQESTVARFGGDELVVLVDPVGGDADLAGIAGRIVEALAKPFELGGPPCRISCSIGISRFPEDGATVSDLVIHADIAMYEVKTSGRNGYRFHAPGMAGFLAADRRTAG